MIIFSWDGRKERKIVAGEYTIATRTFHKKCAEEHLCMKYPGSFGIDVPVMDELNRMKCLWIHVFFRGEEYKVDFNEWYFHGRRDNLDGITGEQIFYRIIYPVMEPLRRIDPKPDPQMRLF